MTAAGYVLGLLSILSGLAIADLVVSLNRLIRAGGKVKWDWLAPLGAAIAAASVVVAWWYGWQNTLDPAYTPTFGKFIVSLGQMVLLFLLSCAALPDNAPDEGTDLRAYYDDNGRYFWGLYALLTLSFLIKDVIILRMGDLPYMALGLVWAGFTLVVALALTFSRRRWLHMLLAPVILALAVVPNLGWSLPVAPA